MKAYISGKMTGLKIRKIKRNFGKVEKHLAKEGFSVINPAITYNLKRYDQFTFEDWLKIDFAMLSTCDIVFAMKNWKDSLGAKLEIAYACRLDKWIFFENPDGSFSQNSELQKQIEAEADKYGFKNFIGNNKEKKNGRRFQV